MVGEAPEGHTFGIAGSWPVPASTHKIKAYKDFMGKMGGGCFQSEEQSVVTLGALLPPPFRVIVPPSLWGQSGSEELLSLEVLTAVS